MLLASRFEYDHTKFGSDDAQVTIYSALAGIDRASVITQIYPNGADLFVHMERDPPKALLVLTFFPRAALSG